MKTRPSHNDAQYVKVAPNQEPNVPAAMTPNVFNFPCVARNAAGGITISLGTGKIELSIAMSKMIPM
jgi:hypothetical protein